MRTIILTGATGGLGSVFAKRILEEHIGKLICIYRNELKFHSIFKDIRRDMLPYLTHEQDDFKKIKKTIESLNTDEIILVLNASTILPIKLAGDFSYEEIKEMTSGNIIQNVTLLNCVCGFCKEQACKLKIINLDSGAADFPLTGWGNYCASKAYINALLSVIALENPGFKVVSFDPGVMDTPMQEQIRETEQSVFDRVDQFISYKIEGKLVEPKVIADEIIERYITSWRAETLRERHKTLKGVKNSL